MSGLALEPSFYDINLYHLKIMSFSAMALEHFYHFLVHCKNLLWSIIASKPILLFEKVKQEISFGQTKTSQFILDPLSTSIGL